MKRKIIPFIICGLLLTSGVAWAKDRYETIEVYFERIHLNINGQQVFMPADSMIYGGSVYVPIRSLTEGLGAEMAWDDDDRTVMLDFLHDGAEQVDAMFNASQKRIYQYLVIQHQAKMEQMIEAIRTENFVEMKTIIRSYNELKELARGIQDTETAGYFEKIMVAADLIRGGLESNKVDDYYLAWTLFKRNVEQLNAHFDDMLSRTTFSLEKAVPVRER